ncbi:MAG: hypothetical protein U0271_09405 [Polyangiaceae bacterium]
MSRIQLELSRHTRPLDIEQAATLASTWLGVLSRALREPLVLSPRSPSAAGARTGQPSARLSFSTEGDPKSVEGRVDIVFASRVATTQPGLSLEALVHCGPIPWAELLREWVEEGQLDAATIRPFEQRHLPFGWLNYRLRPVPEPLPRGATQTRLGDGWLIQAHARGAEHDDDDARFAILEMALATKRGLSAPRELAAPLGALSTNTTESRVPLLSIKQVQDFADATVPIAAPLAPRPALPFGGTTPRAVVAEMFGTPVRESTAPRDPADETLALPQTSLDDYVAIRAQLLVDGDLSAEAWADYGLTTSAAREAVRVHFATMFMRDPALQRRFLSALDDRVRALRERAKP